MVFGVKGGDLMVDDRCVKADSFFFYPYVNAMRSDYVDGWLSDDKDWFISSERLTAIIRMMFPKFDPEK